MEEETILGAIILGIGAVYFLVSGLSRIIRGKITKQRWRPDRRRLAVREKVEITGFGVVLRGIIRLIIGGFLAYWLSLLIPDLTR